MNYAQRLHWEYQQRRAKKHLKSRPGAAKRLIREAEHQLRQPPGALA